MFENGRFEFDDSEEGIMVAEKNRIGEGYASTEGVWAGCFIIYFFFKQNIWML